MPWNRVVALLIGLASLMLAGWALAQLGRAALPGVWLIGLDGDITTFFSGRRTMAATQLMLGMTMLGDLWVVAVLVGALGLAHRLRHGRWRGLWVPMIAGAGAFAVSVVVKLSTGRDRPPDPYAVIDAVGSAFPSGHSLRAIAVYGAIAWLAAAVALRRRNRVLIWAVTVTVVLGVGLSRVYLGAHWMTDVLVGYALGGLWLWLVIVVASAKKRPSVEREEPTHVEAATPEVGQGPP